MYVRYSSIILVYNITIKFLGKLIFCRRTKLQYLIPSKRETVIVFSFKTVLVLLFKFNYVVRLVCSALLGIVLFSYYVVWLARDENGMEPLRTIVASQLKKKRNETPAICFDETSAYCKIRLHGTMWFTNNINFFGIVSPIAYKNI